MQREQNIEGHNNSNNEAELEAIIVPEATNKLGEVPSPSTSTVTPASDLVAVFSSAITTTISVDLNRNSAQPKNVTPRLKQSQYREVLTSAEVVEHLKEAERLREEKNKRNPREQKATKEKAKRKCKKHSESEDEINKLQEDELCNDSDEEMNKEGWAEEIALDSHPEVEYILPNWQLIKPGIYLLVKFLGGSRNSMNYEYVCRMRKVDDETEDIEVVGFKRNDIFAREFVENGNDISFTEFRMIEAVLPETKTEIKSRKIIHVFPGTVRVFEK